MKHEITAGQFLFINAVLYVIIQINDNKYGLLNLHAGKCVFDFKFSGVLTTTYLRSLKTDIRFPKGHIKIINKLKIVHSELSFSEILPSSVSTNTVISTWTVSSSSFKRYLLMINIQGVPSLVDMYSWKVIIQFESYSYCNAVPSSEIHKKLRHKNSYDTYLVKERCSFRKKQNE